jgi:hypothetical protein
MQYREIIAVCSQIHTKHIHSLCGQNAEFFSVKRGEWYIYQPQDAKVVDQLIHTVITNDSSYYRGRVGG